MRDCHRTALILILVLIAGCSGLRIGYRHADTFLLWRADEYFDFDARQKQDFSARLERLLTWHRYEQLPEYAAFISTAVMKAQDGLRREDLVWFVDGFKARYRVIVERGAGDAAAVLATITPEQILELQKQWDKNNRKFAGDRELDGTPADRKRARLKLALGSIKDWAGSLADEQEQRIAALLDPIPHIDHLRHLDRIRRQKEFLELLKLRADKQAFQPKLHAWLMEWEHGRSAEFARRSSEVYEMRMQFYIAVEKVLTPEQRRHVLRRLQEYADDFREMSAKPRRAGRAPSESGRLALF